MTTAEKLLQISEGVDKVEALNTELEQTLYGGDTGYRGYYDEFWDNFQDNGRKVYYDYAFSESGNGANYWRYGTSFRPKHPIKPKTAQNMFVSTRLPYEAIAMVDFSVCTDFYCTFQYSTTTKFPPIDLRKATRTNNLFGNNTRVEEIEEILVAESTPYNACFSNCSKLKEIRFNGTIGKNGLDFKYSTELSKASITSIFNALSTTISGLSVTLSKTAVNNAFTTEEWNALVATRTNWTISLV